jgi:hypothetical protein
LNEPVKSFVIYLVREHLDFSRQLFKARHLLTTSAPDPPMQGRHPLLIRASDPPVRLSRFEESLQTPGGTVQRDHGLAAPCGTRNGRSRSVDSKSPLCGPGQGGVQPRSTGSTNAPSSRNTSRAASVGGSHEYVGQTSRIWRSRICRGNRGLRRGNAPVLQLGFCRWFAPLCLLWLRLGCRGFAVGFAPAPGMSAFGGKADSLTHLSERLLIARSGHWAFQPISLFHSFGA